MCRYGSRRCLNAWLIKQCYTCLSFNLLSCHCSPDNYLQGSYEGLPLSICNFPLTKDFRFRLISGISVGRARGSCGWNDVAMENTKWIKSPSLSGRVVYSAVLTAQTVVSSIKPQPKPPPETSASMWINKAWLPCWPPHSQQVLHQGWITGSHRQKSMQWTLLGFKTQGRHHKKSKTVVSVAPRNGLLSSNKWEKNQQWHAWC